MQGIIHKLKTTRICVYLEQGIANHSPVSALISVEGLSWLSEWISEHS
jgi:hypothetical protein